MQIIYHALMISSFLSSFIWSHIYILSRPINDLCRYFRIQPILIFWFVLVRLNIFDVLSLKMVFFRPQLFFKAIKPWFFLKSFIFLKNKIDFIGLVLIPTLEHLSYIKFICKIWSSKLKIQLTIPLFTLVIAFPIT